MMMNESQRQTLRTNGILLARIMLGALFFFSGLNIVLGGLTGTAGMISSLGIPAATLFAVVIAFVKVVGGLCLMIGYRTGLAAASLIAFTLAATLGYHLTPEPGGPLGLQMALWKNMSIIGGLLYAMAYGPGEGWSLQQKERMANASPTASHMTSTVMENDSTRTDTMNTN